MPKTLELLKAELNQHCGSETMYHDALNKNSLYTPGFKHYMTEVGGYWLLSHLSYEIYALLKRRNEHDVFYFNVKVNEESECKLDLRDYKGNILWGLDINYTDHPEGTIKFIVGYAFGKITTCLISEN